MAEETSWKGRPETLKSFVRKAAGPTLIRKANAYLGRASFDEAALIHEVLYRRRGVMIDVGAHYGGVTQMFAASGWRVIAYEPDDKNRAVFKKNISRKEDVTLRTEAVSDRAGQELAFFGSDVSSGISSLAAFHDSHVQRQTVLTTTVSDAMRDYNIAHLDFLKIDTEGFDLFVLKGVDWSRPPDVILCEFEDHKTVPLSYSLIDMHAYLLDSGYKVSISEWYPIVRYGVEHQWRRFTDDPSSVAPNGWGNLIAYRDGDEFGCENIARLGARLFGLKSG